MHRLICNALERFYSVRIDVFCSVGNVFLLARNSLQKSAREILASDFSAVFGMVLIRFTAEKYFCKARLTTKSYGGKLIIVKCA